MVYKSFKTSGILPYVPPIWVKHLDAHGAG